jgi:hypothetical protein
MLGVEGACASRISVWPALLEKTEGAPARRPTWPQNNSLAVSSYVRSLDALFFRAAAVSFLTALGTGTPSNFNSLAVLGSENTII